MKKSALLIFVLLMSLLAAIPVGAQLAGPLTSSDGHVIKRTFTECHKVCATALKTHFDRVELNLGKNEAKVTQKNMRAITANEPTTLALPMWFDTFNFSPEDVDRTQAFNLIDPTAPIVTMEAGDTLYFPPKYAYDTGKSLAKKMEETPTSTPLPLPTPIPAPVPEKKEGGAEGALNAGEVKEEDVGASLGAVKGGAVAPEPTGFPALAPPTNLLSLELPPNLGPANDEGYYYMPDAIDGAYVIGENTPINERCGSLINIAVNYTVGKQWAKIHPNNKMKIGDLNAAEGHATHMTGIDSDITTVGRLAANTVGSDAASLELAKLFARTHEVRQILYTLPGDGSQGLVTEFNNWAKAEGIDTVMTPYANHHHHFHVDMLNRYEGKSSGGCANGTTGTQTAGDNPELTAFAAKYSAEARVAGKRWGFPAEAAIVMAALESGYGGSELTTEYNNFFGHKAGSSWTGQVVDMKTKEQSASGAESTITDGFRVYGSPEEGWDSYGQFLRSVGLYDRAFSHYAHHPLLFIHELRTVGYATDINYVGKTHTLLHQLP